LSSASYDMNRDLADAAFVCDVRRVGVLLARGADPNARDDDGRTPLMSAVLANSIALAGLLLESEADVNARDDQGWTALHFAAEEQLPEMARILIARGADVDAQDGEGRSPLWRAVFSAHGRQEMVELLREAGARDDLPDLEGVTPKQLDDRLAR